MKNLLFTTVSAGLLISVLSAPASAVPVSTNDLWDINQGASVASNSGVVGPPYYSNSWRSDISNMFGGAGGTVEVGNTLFQDYQSTGTVHWVEWQTPATNTLRSISLHTRYDGGQRDARYRGYSLFTLYGWNSSSAIWDQIYKLEPIDISTNRFFSIYEDPTDYLDYATDLTPYTTDKFRAEFTQFGAASAIASGPRIMEIDGFDTFLDGGTGGPPTGKVPEPATLALFGLGLAGLGFARRKKST